MRSKWILIALLLCPSLFGKDIPRQRPFWVYGGFGIGPSRLSTDYVGELNDKTGYHFNLALTGSWYFEDWNIHTGPQWYRYRFESGIVQGQKVTLKVGSLAWNFNPQFRLNHRFSIGPELLWSLGEPYRVSPIKGPGAKDPTTRLVAGANLFYEIPWKQSRMRLGAHYYFRPLGVGEREVHTALFSFHIGFPVRLENYKGRTMMQLTLNEQMINFETNSDRLDGPSAQFLRELGRYLATHKDEWQNLEIHGHTDVRGKAAYNLSLSQKRSSSVVRALSEAGVPKSKLKAEGHGESRPLKMENEPSAHKINRRVEIHFKGETDGHTISLAIKRIRTKLNL